MAQIILQPGERFEHTHPTPSTTALIRGEVELELEGHKVMLTSVPIAIPARTVHVMYNVGRVPAAIECGYEPPSVVM